MNGTMTSPWRKASWSNPSGNCVEVAVTPDYRKARASNSQGACAEVGTVPQEFRKARDCDKDCCVEVGADQPGFVAVRDTKNQEAGPVLEFSPRAWDAFLGTIRKDIFGG